MNQLYPIFLKESDLKTLILGGGAVGLEKLSFRRTSMNCLETSMFTAKR